MSFQSNFILYQPCKRMKLSVDRYLIIISCNIFCSCNKSYVIGLAVYMAERIIICMLSAITKHVWKNSKWRSTHGQNQFRLKNHQGLMLVYITTEASFMFASVC